MARPVENETRSSSDRGDEVGRRQTDEGKRRTNSIVFRSRLGEWDDLRDEVRWWRTKLDRLQIEAEDAPLLCAGRRNVENETRSSSDRGWEQPPTDQWRTKLDRLQIEAGRRYRWRRGHEPGEWRTKLDRLQIEVTLGPKTPADALGVENETRSSSDRGRTVTSRTPDLPSGNENSIALGSRPSEAHCRFQSLPRGSENSIVFRSRQAAPRR